ncbi:MAG TPA: hypothetical protein DEV93_19600 [Chloroflexi bacterium]|nr:hypothetical protein [Chloroflexota bacterium]
MDWPGTEIRILSSQWTMGQLDARLQLLEDASEKGEEFVSVLLAHVVGSGIPLIAAGMPIAHAIDAVFHEQESVLAGRAGELRSNNTRVKSRSLVKANLKPLSSRLATSSVDGRPKPPLDAPAAEELTRRIKTEISSVGLLLSEAHDRRAWVALGYKTWDRYVRIEFGFSRSRSYEILDQAKVVQAVQRAVGSDSIPELSPFAVRQIKPYLGNVLNEIQDRVAAASTSGERFEIVNQVVSRVRTLAAMPTQDPHRTESTPYADVGNSLIDCETLFTALEFIANLPAPNSVLLAALKANPQKLHVLRSATKWLLGLAEQNDLLKPTSRSLGATDPKLCVRQARRPTDRNPVRCTADVEARMSAIADTGES